MNFLQLLYYLVLALGLFLILNYFKKFEEKTPSVMIFIPVIYILVASNLPGISREFVYFIILLEMLFRIYYAKIILNQDELMNTNYYIQNYGIAFILSYLLTEYYIMKVDTVFLTLEEVKITLWFFIILFLYKVFNGNLKIKLEKQESVNMNLKEEAIIVRYARFKNQYSYLVKGKDKDLSILLYAMMVYENYHRSKFLRDIDKVHYRLTGKNIKMGIMQVEANRILTDEESIQMVLKEFRKIEKQITETTKKKKNMDLEILKEYTKNSEKEHDILAIYEVIKNFENK